MKIETSNNIRRNILEVLDLWASKKKQLAYQKNVPIADVSAELFCQWDDFYHPDDNEFKKVFNSNERSILAEFSQIIEEVSEKTPKDLPYISDFVKSNEWAIVNQVAIETLQKLNIRLPTSQ
jgi:hypothetical protein